MKKIRIISSAIVAVFLVCGIFIAYSWFTTEATINKHKNRVEKLGLLNPSPIYDAAKIKGLPEPVQQYFKFVFKGVPPQVNLVKIEMEGDFRRPKKETFSRTKAQQTIAAGTPAFVFSATTPFLSGMWVRVYDAFVDFKMEMKAKILSMFTVLDEKETPALNQTSLRRWLIESSLFPVALLPGGAVTWENVDMNHARAVISLNGIYASLIASFNSDGSLASFQAETDGDLTTPYHGSGEHVLRGDYKMVSGMMIPHTFTVSRVAKGKIMPFWKGKITSIKTTFL